MKINLPHQYFNFLVVSFHDSKAKHRGGDCQFWLDILLEGYMPCSRLKFWKCKKIEVFAFSNSDTDFKKTIYAEKINGEKNGTSN